MSAFERCSGRHGKYISTVIPQTSHLQGEGDDTKETSLGTSMIKLQSFPFWNIVDQFHAEFKYLQNHRFNLDNVFCKFS